MKVVARYAPRQGGVSPPSPTLPALVCHSSSPNPHTGGGAGSAGTSPHHTQQQAPRGRWRWCRQLAGGATVLERLRVGLTLARSSHASSAPTQHQCPHACSSSSMCATATLAHKTPATPSPLTHTDSHTNIRHNCRREAPQGAAAGRNASNASSNTTSSSSSTQRTNMRTS